MPVLSNKLNEMIELYNLIRDILDEPRLDLNKLNDLLRQITLRENINYITKAIVNKIIYYIIEIAHDEEGVLEFEKFSHLANTLEEMTEIIKKENINKKAELLRAWIRCQNDGGIHSPFFNNLKYITKQIIKETKRLLLENNQPEQLVSDLDDEDEHTWQRLL